MKKLVIVGLTVAAVAVTVLPTTAQNPGTTLSTYALIQQLSARADAMQSRLDALSGPASSAQHIDSLQLGLSSGVYYANIGAWAWSCGTAPEWNQGSEYVVIDGIELPLLPASRVIRNDVVSAYNGFCGGGQQVPSRNGVNYSIPMTLFGSGPSENGWHAVKLRTYDTYGRMAETAYQYVQVPQ